MPLDMKTLRVKKLASLSGKTIGLIGVAKPYPVFFQTRFGIHTIFMKISIDVLILDKDFRVVKVAENLKPNNLFFWSPRFDKVIELPAGEIKKNAIQLGEKINLSDVV